jgi:hypothetical protein
MKRQISYLATLSFTFSSTLHAACEEPTTVRARVSVLSCEPKIFYATQSAFDYFKSSGTQPDPTQVSVSGTLITAQVLADQPADTPSDIAAMWTKGQQKKLFVDKPATEVCTPAVELTVATTPQCCDTFPFSGLCLLPAGVPVVVIQSRH